jgi:16S rRNA G966 N2-methylase RsmD
VIERNFQIPFVARLAMAEKQIQQNYRPLIAVHKWFARRPGTLFRSLLLSEFGEGPVGANFYHSHDFSDKHVFDPFMGGGTTVIEANRLGCAVSAMDINPMAWWIVRQEIQDLDLVAYQKAANELRAHLRREVGESFKTRCPRSGLQADVKYFLWVKTIECPSCGQYHDLFPNHLIAQDVRHTANVFTCGHCGELYESDDRNPNEPCPSCERHQPTNHRASRGKTKCLHCDKPISYPNGANLGHRLFAMEYYLPEALPKGQRKGRLFKAPDAKDLATVAAIEERAKLENWLYVPDDAIPEGDETERLHRWGYQHYRELFNPRQLLGLELSCRWIANVKDTTIREALATNLSDLLRYQNMLCRYDIMALKSLDIFSVHGFPVGLIHCESNILGIEGPRGLPVGSGGWLNITEKFRKAKAYCVRPFEIRHTGKTKQEVAIEGEWIGTYRNGTHPPETREVNLRCGDSSEMNGSVTYQAIFTDPPYFGNVQYAELMDFCYVWLRKLVGEDRPEFACPSTRNAAELTGNVNMGRDLIHFTEGLAKTFLRAAQRLELGCPLAFTYHHNKLEAYIPLAVAILDAGLTCSASLPCPAEMGASIHINGTGSSIIDTVFVSRKTGTVPRKWLAESPLAVAELVQNEVDQLADAGLKATQGDIRCIIHGHLTRLAIWSLRRQWNASLDCTEKMNAVREWMIQFGGLETVLGAMKTTFKTASKKQVWLLNGVLREEHEDCYEVPF